MVARVLTEEELNGITGGSYKTCGYTALDVTDMSVGQCVDFYKKNEGRDGAKFQFSANVLSKKGKGNATIVKLKRTDIGNEFEFKHADTLNGSLFAIDHKLSFGKSSV